MLRQETLELASGPVVCQVIEVEQQPSSAQTQYSPMTYWIDAGHNLVLKLNYRVTIKAAGRPSGSESIITVEFKKATAGQPVDEALLRFTPPAGAVEVERLSFGPKSPPAGIDSPQFELAGGDGKPISSASLRGRVVLLQFSPGPDDDSLFILEMTYRSLRNTGLTALYVLPSRNRPRCYR